MMPASSPRLFLMDPATLDETRRRVAANDDATAPAIAVLRRQADEALALDPPSVMNKTLTPASGDKHDYMSGGTYWWPDPDTPDGLPYIRRDGERNPENDALDCPGLRSMVEACRTLSVAWYLTEDDRCAAGAATLLRVWFLDESTRMNPHLEFAQAIPGICDGRDIGIIDTSSAMALLIDATGLVQAWPRWPSADGEALQAWMAAYLQWLLDSPHGRGAAEKLNNHGTWFDTQSMALGLFVGRRDLALSVAEAYGAKRIASQIETDGSQPLELARTQSMGYTAMNLAGFQQAAALAAHVGVDLWNWETPDGRGLRRALDWLAPFATGAQEWTYPQIKPLEPDVFVALYRHAALAYHDSAYERVVESIPGLRHREHRVNLTHPRLTQRGQATLRG